VEAYPNHVYPINHKFKDCRMMKDFMTSGSLTQGKELEEDPGGRDTTSFPREDAVITVYNGHPPPGRRRMSNLSLGTKTRCPQGWKETSLQIYIYIYGIRHLG
jgi:hypothetical protein